MLSRFEQFTLAISGIYRSIQKIERKEMERYGLKGGCAQYLVALSQNPEGLTAAQLCELCDVDKAAVSRALSELESRGMVCRQGGLTGYRAKLTLTDEGCRVAAYTRRCAMAAVEAAGQDLSPETRAALYTALQSISGHLQTIQRQGIPQKDKE